MIPKHPNWKIVVKAGIAYVLGMTTSEYKRLTPTELKRIHDVAYAITAPISGFVMAGYLCHIKHVHGRVGLQTTAMRHTLHHKVDGGLADKTMTEKKAVEAARTVRIEGISKTELAALFEAAVERGIVKFFAKAI